LARFLDEDPENQANPVATPFHPMPLHSSVTSIVNGHSVTYLYYPTIKKLKQLLNPFDHAWLLESIHIPSPKS
jgi:hypothetical protein